MWLMNDQAYWEKQAERVLEKHNLTARKMIVDIATTKDGETHVIVRVGLESARIDEWVACNQERIAASSAILAHGRQKKTDPFNWQEDPTLLARLEAAQDRSKEIYQAWKEETDAARRVLTYAGDDRTHYRVCIGNEYDHLCGVPHPDAPPAPPVDRSFKRIERPIRHKGWQFLHNFIAHPLLAIYRPWGAKLHEYTAVRMYSDDPNDWYPADYEDAQG